MQTYRIKSHQYKYTNTLPLRYKHGSVRRHTKAGEQQCMEELQREEKTWRKKYRMKSKRKYEATVVVLVDKALFSLSQDLNHTSHTHLQVRGIYSKKYFFHIYFSSSVLRFVIFLLLCFFSHFQSCLLSLSPNTHTLSLSLSTFIYFYVSLSFVL